MIQTETERQFYLGMAGVRLWYARDALPGAAPSPEYVFASEDEDVAGEPPLAELPSPARPKASTQQPTAEGPAAGAARVANLQALMESPSAPGGTSVEKPASDEAARAAVPDVATSEEDESPAIERGIALNLQLWVGRGVALVASLSEDASLRLQGTLAENILKSVGETGLRHVGPIRWPVFNNLRAPGNSLADLRSVLGHAFADLQGQKVIALGLTGPAGYAGDGDWLQHVSGVDPDVNFPHTLAEMASNPSFKRALWQELKPLAGQ